MTGRPIRILLVDDHAVVREGYRRLIEKQGDLEVVSEADPPPQRVPEMM